MEKRIRKVVYSTAFYKDSQNIYLYGKETFGKIFADLLIEEMLQQKVYHFNTTFILNVALYQLKAKNTEILF